MHRRRKEYSEKVESALEDGVITAEEEAELQEIQEDLGIRMEDAKDILETELKVSGEKVAKCPHCGEPLILHDRRTSDRDGSEEEA